MEQVFCNFLYKSIKTLLCRLFFSSLSEYTNILPTRQYVGTYIVPCMSLVSLYYDLPLCGSSVLSYFPYSPEWLWRYCVMTFSVFTWMGLMRLCCDISFFMITWVTIAPLCWDMASFVTTWVTVAPLCWDIASFVTTWVTVAPLCWDMASFVTTWVTVAPLCCDISLWSPEWLWRHCVMIFRTDTVWIQIQSFTAPLTYRVTYNEIAVVYMKHFVAYDINMKEQPNITVTDERFPKEARTLPWGGYRKVYLHVLL